MTTVELITAEETLEEISHLVDTRKSTVKIDRETLSRLLIDYDVMRGALRSSLFKVNTPAKRARARLE